MDHPTITKLSPEGEVDQYPGFWFDRWLDENNVVLHDHNSRGTWTFTPEPNPEKIVLFINERPFQHVKRHRLMEWLEWEHNGYHDSYFYRVYWDADLQEAFQKEIGSTAYAGGCPMNTVPWDNEQIENARQWHEGKIFEMLKQAEERDIMSPQKVLVGDRVRLLEQQKNQATTVKEEACPKCGGTGKWVNPRNKEDERTCFACNGTKTIKQKGEKLKDEKGKTVWEIFDKDTAGKVVWVGTFRTMYRNGYNQPNRGTLSCRVQTDDGRNTLVPLKKLRLDREPMSDAELRKRAADLSQEMNAKPHFSSHGGWNSTNIAARYLAAKMGRHPIEEKQIVVVIAGEQE